VNGPTALRLARDIKAGALTVMRFDRARLPLDLGAPVHDGDTLRLELDRGFDDRSVRDLRLYGVFAPELKQPGGLDTTAYVVGWLRAQADGAGSWPLAVDSLRVRDDSHEQVTLGRYLAIVYSHDRTHCLNDDVMAYVKANGYGGGTGS